MPIYYLDSGSIDNLEISSSLLVSGTLTLSGSLRTSGGGLTGSLLGTASWADNAVTASYVQLAQTASFVTLAQTASFVTTAQTASYVTGSVFSSTNPALSASFATTASFAVSASWAPGGQAAATFPYTGSAIISGSLIVTGSVSSTEGFTGSIFGTASWTNYPIAASGSTIYSTVYNNTVRSLNNNTMIGSASGFDATGISNSNFLGVEAGYSASNASNSNFLGRRAGFGAVGANNSNFFGREAGYLAVSSLTSVFIGEQAGKEATNAQYSVFLGNSAGSGSSADDSNFFGYRSGERAVVANRSNFFGFQAGLTATSASDSNFLGYRSGDSAILAQNSNFFGFNSGRSAVSASYSTFIGFQAGYNTRGDLLALKSNNIIIGTNITLADTYSNGINIGGILFGSGSYSTTTGNPFSGSVGNGRIGINQPDPQYSLDVSGSGNYLGSLRVAGSGSNIFVVSGSQGSLLNISEKTATDTRIFTVSSASINLLTVNDDKSTRISGSLIVTGSITGSLFGTSSYAITASFALNGGGGGGEITIADEGTAQGTATFLNFIGDAVTATVTSNTASITITAGGGSGFPFEGTAVITGSIALSTGSAIFPTLTAAESLAAGDFVNVYSGGVRKASSNDTSKQAHGFVIQAYNTSDPVFVYYSGLNTSITGLTAGSRYFLGTSGGETTTPPTSTGQLSQEVGVAISTTAILVNLGPAIVT